MLLPRSGDPKELASLVVDLERVGLDIIWVPEPYGFDAVSMMGYLAGQTSRIQVGSGILPIYSRTPTLMAMTAAGIDFVSGGRAILGIGASGPQVIEGWHGVPYDRPIARTAEIIEICRMVLRRERLQYQGDIYTLPLPSDQGTGLGKPLKMINAPVRSDVPIWVASLGPTNVQMTAATADGWLPLFFDPARADGVWGEALERGYSQRSDALGPLEICAGGDVSIGAGAESHRDRARGEVALYVGGMGAKGKNFYNELVRKYGYEREAEEIQDRFLEGNRDRAMAAVPETFLESISLCGSEGYVRERIAAYHDAGVTVLSINPVGGDPVRIVEQIATWVHDA